jgi:hypothetical protein
VLSTRTTVPETLFGRPLAEQTRNRDHDSSDEYEQARKQHNVTQEHTHARASPSSYQNSAGSQLDDCCCRHAGFALLISGQATCREATPAFWPFIDRGRID